MSHEHQASSVNQLVGQGQRWRIMNHRVEGCWAGSEEDVSGGGVGGQGARTNAQIDGQYEM